MSDANPLEHLYLIAHGWRSFFEYGVWSWSDPLDALNEYSACEALRIQRARCAEAVMDRDRGAA